MLEGIFQKTNIASRWQNPAWVSYLNLCKISSIALSMWKLQMKSENGKLMKFAERYTPRNFTHNDTPPQKRSLLNLSLSLFIPGFIPMASFWSVEETPPPFEATTSFCRARSFSAERCSNISTCKTTGKGGWKVGGFNKNLSENFEGC